jgi:hypothetical protein
MGRLHDEAAVKDIQALTSDVSRTAQSFFKHWDFRSLRNDRQCLDPQNQNVSPWRIQELSTGHSMALALVRAK